MKILKNERDHEYALKRIEALMDIDDSDMTKEEGEELDLLATLVEIYEDEHYPIGTPTPIGAIRFRMDQEGLSQRDLIPYIGSRSKVSEVLSGKRQLSINMIRRLHGGLGIPLESLLGGEDEVAALRSGVKRAMAAGDQAAARALRGEIKRLTQPRRSAN